MKTTNSLSEFIEAYTRAVNRVSGMPKPMSEFELMPLFKPNYSFIPRFEKNVSRMRPVMVMDLVHAAVNNQGTHARNLFREYDEELQYLYPKDRFSNGTNLPNVTPGITKQEIKDAKWFATSSDQRANAITRLNEYLVYSYKTNGDIFADETYEVLGPYQPELGISYLVRRFHVPWVVGGTVDFIIGGRGTVDIDMFGHTNENFLEKTTVSILIGGEFVDEAPPVPADTMYPLLDARYLYGIHAGRRHAVTNSGYAPTTDVVTDLDPFSLIDFLRKNLS